MKVLWLHDNPCAMVDNYREIVIHHLPNLVKLDNNIITQEERVEAQKTQFDIMAGGENMDNESMYANTPPVVEKHSSKMSEEKRSRPFSELPREARESREERSTLVENPWRGGGSNINNNNSK